MAWFCGACNANVATASEMTLSGLQTTCLQCGSMAVEKREEGISAERDPSKPLQPAPAVATNVGTLPLRPVNLLRAARARVKEINRELKRLGSLKQERDELERLLRAAKGSKTAKVIQLREAKG